MARFKLSGSSREDKIYDRVWVHFYTSFLERYPAADAVDADVFAKAHAHQAVHEYRKEGSS